MIEVQNDTTRYFKAPLNYFWRWADNGTVIEWQNGNTICYRDDLALLLQQMSNQGLPPLSSLLLLLAACRAHLHLQDRFFITREIGRLKNEDHANDAGAIDMIWADALHFLNIVASLPENLRSGAKRIHLVHEIFDNITFTIASRQLQHTLQEFNSGRFDKDIFGILSDSVGRDEFISHFQCFSNAFKKYPTVQSLVLKLRTGLDELPKPVNIALPDSSALDIFDQLLQDPQTAGIARLAKRLVATLNIPMQSKGSSDQPFGGISDITNRGSYDRLLLSELAYDDELLMARLVNNEALYFRREEPPEQPRLQRIILIDSTLKMWGTSRIFALAAGLANAQSTKHAILMQAYMLGGSDYTPVNLVSRPGIIQALEKLDHALHCGRSLEAVIDSVPFNASDEIILITHARLLFSPGFHASLAAVKKSISFIITVSNTGDLAIYEYTNGVSRQISSAKIDLDELLYEPAIKAKKIKRDKDSVPLFLTYQPSPLYFAPARIKINPDKTFVQPGFGSVMISETQRVLFAKQEKRALAELLNYIEKGVYTFSAGTSKDSLYILVSNQGNNLLKLYKIDVATFEHTVINLARDIPFFSKAAFQNDILYLRTNNAVLVYDCIAEIVVDKQRFDAFEDILNKPRYSLMEIQNVMRGNNNLIHNESIFYRIGQMYIDENDQLVIGKQVLNVHHRIHISFSEYNPKSRKNKYAKPLEEPLFLTPNKNIRFNVWIWEDGSEAIIDSRGMLHLKSADPSIPEITIVMVLSLVSACWASDGMAAGSAFFINEKITRSISTREFYDSYIQQYINQVKST